MPTAWVAWRKILSCKQESDVAVHDPKGAITSNPTPTPLHKLSAPALMRANAGVHLHVKKRRSTSSSVCCSDLKNVVHGNTRVVHRSDHDSPLSPHHMTNVPTHHQQLKLLIQEPFTLLHSPHTDRSAHAKKLSSSSCYDCSIASCEPPDSPSPQSHSRQSVANWCAPSTCHKCGDSIADLPDALEEHHASHHAVTELKEGDSAWSIVEIIFQTSWLRQDALSVRPERIFKVHSSPKTVAKFEEYRAMVMAKASKISKKHSRCLVDGNELLRFYSTTVACHMGKMPTSISSYAPSSSSLCASSSCGVCHILRYGFPTKDIYTNASSGHAHKSIMLSKEYDKAANVKHAMLVCRVIAGRVKKAGYESSQDGLVSSYDSVAGEAGLYTDLEELLVFNNRAVLPCFVVIYS